MKCRSQEKNSIEKIEEEKCIYSLEEYKPSIILTVLKEKMERINENKKAEVIVWKINLTIDVKY